MKIIIYPINAVMDKFIGYSTANKENKISGKTRNKCIAVERCYIYILVTGMYMINFTFWGTVTPPTLFEYKTISKITFYANSCLGGSIGS